ncbi:MAG: ligand-binding sensor domain-containing protein [Candidatus Latescibacterota bacterium]
MKKEALSAVLFLIISGGIQAERWECHVPGNDIVDVTFQGEYVWCSTVYSMVRWDRRDESYVQYTARDYGQNRWPGAVTADSRGTFWAGSGRGTGVMRFDGYSWTEPDVKDLPDGVTSLRPLHTDRAGNAWFSAPGVGAARFDGESWRVYAPKDTLKYVNEIIADREGALWFAAEEGAWRLMDGHWRRYAAGDGLAGDRITSALADSSGILWFGTDKGLSRFDGSSWKTYTTADGLPDNRVNALAIDLGGNLWLGTGNGVVRMNGDGMEVFRYPESLLSQWVSDLAVDHGGKIWCCHGNPSKGVSVYENGTFRRVTPADGFPDAYARSVACDRTGILWFALDTGAASFNGVSWRVYTDLDGLVKGNIRQIFVDSGNRKWFSYISGRGLTCFDGETWRTWTVADGLASNTIRAVGQGGDGLIYAGTTGCVCRFAGERWEKLSNRERLLSQDIHRMAEERDGALWFATGCGISRFDGGFWRTWTVADGLPGDWVQAVSIAPDGRVWFIAEEQLCNLSGDSLTVHPAPRDAATGKPLPLGPLAIDTEGTVWACAGGRTGMWTNIWYYPAGIWRYRKSAWEHFPLPFPEDPSLSFARRHYVSGIYADERGDIWIPFRSGLLRVHKGQCTILEANTPGTLWCYDIAVDQDNTIWLANAELAVHTWPASYKNGRWVNLNGIAEHMLDARRIKVDSRNRKWFLTGEGIVRYDGATWETMTGLIHGNPGTLIIAPDDALWFGSPNEGLWRWDGAEWTNFTTADGLPSNDITPRAFSPDGTLWCSMGDDIAWFDGRVWRTHHLEVQWESLTVDRNGAAWVATVDGILRYDGTEWVNIGRGTEYELTWIRQVAIDMNGILWAATWDGILRYDGQQWKRYTFADGLPDDKINRIAVDHLNRKWISTQRGICMLDDSEPSATPDSAPLEFALHGNHPNPFNPSTTISFTLSEPGRVDLAVYSVSGQRVRTLLSDRAYRPNGTYRIVWDGKDERGYAVSSGVYFTRLITNGRAKTLKMLLVR